MEDKALILFIRNPEKGKVKTRLAQGVGDEQALRIYEALLEHTRRQALAVEARRLLFYSESINRNDEWREPGFEKYLQEGEGLGERMSHSFEIALRQARAALIVGSDIAQLSARIIEDAFRQLQTHDFVIGPAVDGGYYLLGMKAPTPTLFEGIEWSTPTVFVETVAIIEGMGKTYALAPELSDIDYAEDWERYGWGLE
ncbi:MAG: TIGR04282 family arsenosugar biosynthesis glycosyltransferase [Lewinellaceae bacterium]|nr:TIGR04282 family arsenosugar biosynthesis glycosyltransferase [Lewinellaceae bacterium]